MARPRGGKKSEAKKGGVAAVSGGPKQQQKTKGGPRKAPAGGAARAVAVAKVPATIAERFALLEQQRKKAAPPAAAATALAVRGGGVKKKRQNKKKVGGAGRRRGGACRRCGCGTASARQCCVQACWRPIHACCRRAQAGTPQRRSLRQWQATAVGRRQRAQQRGSGGRAGCGTSPRQHQQQRRQRWTRSEARSSRQHQEDHSRTAPCKLRLAAPNETPYETAALYEHPLGRSLCTPQLQACVHVDVKRFLVPGVRALTNR